MDEGKIKILVVDDEVDFTQAMSFWFKSKGYATTVANDGEAAVTMVREDTPDIIFLDLKMPGIDGIETLRRIRQLNKGIPVVIISAYVDRLLVEEAEPYSVSGVFYKGKDFEEGLVLLESILRTHKKLKR